MNTTDKKSRAYIALEVVLIAATLVILMGVVYHFFPSLIGYLRARDVDGLTDYLRQEGNWGELMLIGVQAIETISIVLPAMPVYICAGMLFGKVKGILLCYLTNLVLNAAMFLFARRAGERVAHLSGKERLQKVEALMERVKRPDLATVIMYLVPIVPNGMIPTIASRTTITLRQYLLCVAIGSLPSIALQVVCGDLLLTIDWNLSVPLILLLIAAALLLVLFRKRISAWLMPRLRKVAGELASEHTKV